MTMSSDDMQFQLATTAALARLEQRAEDQASRIEKAAEVLRDALHASDRVHASLDQRLISLEQSRAASKAVLGFSRGVLLVSAAVVSAAVSVAAQLVTG